MTSDHPVDALTPESLMGQARTAVNLDDFGGTEFVEGLEQLLASIRSESRLTPAGVEMTRLDMLRLLTNRLLLQQDWLAHPDIAAEELVAPIVILGLPRTGTSKLQRMIAADPGVQRLETWRHLHPGRLPTSDPGAPDPRIAMAEQLEAMAKAQLPELYAAHPSPAREVDEDEFLLELTFEHEVFRYFYRVPSYLNWVEKRSMAGPFAYLRQVLQHLQWQDGGGRGRPWVLKSPPHLRHVDDLLQAFPGAVLVRCHRDPAVCIPSITKALEVSRRARSSEVDLAELGQEMLASWSAQVREHLDLEGKLGLQGEILDLHYEDIRDSPHDVLGRVYERAGRPLTAEATEQFRRWEETNPQYRFGQHEYSLERYGLTEREVRAAFADYIDRFL